MFRSWIRASVDQRSALIVPDREAWLCVSVCVFLSARGLVWWEIAVRASFQCQSSPSLDYTGPFYTIDTIFTRVELTMCLWLLLLTYPCKHNIRKAIFTFPITGNNENWAEWIIAIKSKRISKWLQCGYLHVMLVEKED